jgi:hypothetical protein
MASAQHEEATAAENESPVGCPEDERGESLTRDERTRTADTAAVVMARSVIGLHQRVSNACAAEDLDAGEKTLKDPIQVRPASIPWKPDEASERLASPQVGKKPPLGWWEKCGQLVEREADGDREAGLKHGISRKLVQTRLKARAEGRQPTLERHGRRTLAVRRARRQRSFHPA